VCVYVCKIMCFYLKWCIKKKKNIYIYIYIYKTKYKNSTQEYFMLNSEFWLNKN